MSDSNKWESCASISGNVGADITLSVVWFVCLAVILFTIIRHQFIQQLFLNQNGILRIFKYTTLLCCVWGVTLCAAESIRSLIWALYCLRVSDLRHYDWPLVGTTLTCYVMILLSLSVIFVARLKTTFAGSVFAISVATYKTFVGLIVFDFLLGAISVILISVLGLNQVLYIAGVFMVLSFVLYLVLSIFLLFLFIRTLRKLAVSFLEAPDMSKAGSVDSKVGTAVSHAPHASHASHVRAGSRSPTVASQSPSLDIAPDVGAAPDLEAMQSVDSAPVSSSDVPGDDASLYWSPNSVGSRTSVASGVGSNEHESDACAGKETYKSDGTDAKESKVDTSSRSRARTRSRATSDAVQINLVDIMSKYSILVFFQLCSTLMHVVMFGMWMVGNAVDVWQIRYVYWYYTPIELVCNVFSLLLQYKFNENLYVRVCNTCHKSLKNRLLPEE